MSEHALAGQLKTTQIRERFQGDSMSQGYFPEKSEVLEGRDASGGPVEESGPDPITGSILDIGASLFRQSKAL